MRREFSAGGIVVRRIDGLWHVAAIRPAGKDGVWALPKGNIDTGERGIDAAEREVREETGLDATLVEKLGETKYVYRWRGERVFKVVTFFLFRYESGELQVAPEHAHEVADARWIPLDQAPEMLTYGGEKQLAEQAIEAVTRIS